MTDSRAWMVRAGNDNELLEPFLREEVVSIGWNDIHDLSSTNSRDGVKRQYREAYPDHSPRRVSVNAGQLYRFAYEIKDGDLILTYDKSTRQYYFGRVRGAYQWKPDDEPAEYPHVRTVEWNDEPIDRDVFSTSVKNTLGSSLTVFSLDEHRERLERVLASDEEERVEVKEETEEDSPQYFEEVQSTADELISDIIANMDPFDFEELVAAVLRAMGYTARRTGDGSDHGVDVIAHPDALGFEAPLVKVQVKRRENAMGSPEVRDFIGTLNDNEKGLYVSIGGYTSAAREEGARTSRHISLFDRDDFIDLLLQHYENIDPEHRTLVPLKQVYVPTKE